MREQDSDEPAHHARRPMNAFLIFCKRHRSVVRDKYPNLENRSITKILGEWWANLDKEDKACYTGLAKQYKDAFFNANPDFKWYKLPAPPLRTVSSRPRENQDTPCDENDIIYEKTNNNSTKVDFNNKHDTEDYQHEYTPLSMFTPGKLADEANMGGLSSLLAAKTEAKNSSNNIHLPFKFNDVKSRIDYGKIKKPKEETIRELQNALSETTRLFEDFEDSKEKKHTVTKSDQLTHQDVINQIVEKRLSKDDEFGYQRHSSDDEKNTKSGRSCKGKRYQEFMAVGGLIVNKRQKRDYNDRSPDEGYGACSWEPTSSRTEEIYEETKQNTSFNDTQLNDTFDGEPKSDPEISETDNNINKFTASDFDLDAKIKALPSLSLEKFQQRKRENKRRKRNMAARPKMYEPPRSTSRLEDRREASESWSDVVVGSQKRKPRKISITRLEINSLVSNTDRMEHKTSPEIMLAHEAPCTVVHGMELCKQPAHENTDLFALATLAEVAAHTSKIENVAAVILSNLSAKTRDDASKV